MNLNFSDRVDEFRKIGAEVVAVSCDSVHCHYSWWILFIFYCCWNSSSKRVLFLGFLVVSIDISFVTVVNCKFYFIALLPLIKPFKIFCIIHFHGLLKYNLKHVIWFLFQGEHAPREGRSRPDEYPSAGRQEPVRLSRLRSPEGRWRNLIQRTFHHRRKVEAQTGNLVL